MLPLRRMPFRRQIVPSIQSQITRSLSTLAVSTIPASSFTEKTTRPKRAPFAEPYRTTLNLHPYSCDWDSWGHWNFLEVHDRWYDLSEMEFYVRRLAKVSGTIRPLAFLEAVDPCIVFEAAGKYYWLDTACSLIERFGGRWSSHDAFLAAFINTDPPLLKGAVHEFPAEASDLFSAVFAEQLRRAAKAKAKAKSAEILSTT
ncbi:hypothetical protein C8F01DRAFT_1136978 [Mycena amicta]|nr:hypothetical protein C8F01DRAFT_1136978 [Mycena amicta]